MVRDPGRPSAPPAHPCRPPDRRAGAGRCRRPRHGPGRRRPAPGAGRRCPRPGPRTAAPRSRGRAGPSARPGVGARRCHRRQCVAEPPGWGAARRLRPDVGTRRRVRPYSPTGHARPPAARVVVPAQERRRHGAAGHRRHLGLRGPRPPGPHRRAPPVPRPPRAGPRARRPGLRPRQRPAAAAPSLDGGWHRLIADCLAPDHASRLPHTAASLVTRVGDRRRTWRRDRRGT